MLSEVQKLSMNALHLEWSAFSNHVYINRNVKFINCLPLKPHFILLLIRQSEYSFHGFFLNFGNTTINKNIQKGAYYAGINSFNTLLSNIKTLNHDTKCIKRQH